MVPIPRYPDILVAYSNSNQTPMRGSEAQYRSVPRSHTRPRSAGLEEYRRRSLKRCCMGYRCPPFQWLTGLRFGWFRRSAFEGFGVKLMESAAWVEIQLVRIMRLSYPDTPSRSTLRLRLLLLSKESRKSPLHRVEHRVRSVTTVTVHWSNSYEHDLFYMRYSTLALVPL